MALAAANVLPMPGSQPLHSQPMHVDLSSAVRAKVALFRSLLRGRDDLFARRFESRATGKSGYAPACANEWVRGICRKPQIKCANCAHRAFLPMTDQVVYCHLSGHAPGEPPHRHFVAGVYPMQEVETRFCLDADIGLDSYYRLFPGQDTTPRAGSEASSPCHYKRSRASWATAFSWTTASCRGSTSGRFSPAWARLGGNRSKASSAKPSNAGASWACAYPCRRKGKTSRGPSLPRVITCAETIHFTSKSLHLSITERVPRN